MTNFEERQLLLALLSGSSGDLPPDWHFTFSQVGLLHLFCVSGFHIGCLNFFLLRICFWSSQLLPVQALKNRMLLVWGLGPSLLLLPYLVFLDFSFPAVRALFAAGLVLWIRILGLKFSNWFTFLVSIFLASILSNSSLLSIQLSIAAVSGFYLFRSNLQKGSKSNPKAGSKKAILKNGLAISAAPWLASLPIVIYWFHHLPLLAPLINMALLIPIAFSVFTPLVLWVLFYSLKISVLEEYFRSLCLDALEFFVNLLNPLALIPGVALWVPRDTWITYSIAAFATLVILNRILDKIRIKIHNYSLVLIVLAISKILPPSIEVTKAYQLNVGQGDASLVIHPGNEVLAIDVGPPSYGGYPARASQAWAQLGISEFQKILLSHADADHIGGLDSVLLRHRFKTTSSVDGIWLPLASLYYRKLSPAIQSAIEFGVPIHIFPEYTWAQMSPSVSCYSESLGFLSRSNDHSPFCLIEMEGLRFASGGDMSKRKEKLLRWRLGKKMRADILKLNHHGSKSSTSIQFLEAVQPSTVIVSAARKNRYSHPHQDIINRVREKNLQLLHTKNFASIPVHNLTLRQVFRD